MKNKIIIVLRIIFALLFIVSAFVIVSSLISDKMEQDAFSDLAQIVEQERQDEHPGEASQSTEIKQQNPESTDASGNKKTSEGGILPEYKKVFQLNNDLYAWIRIDGTSINFPVMYTPNDPEYYLRRAFDKSNSQSGTPFVDGACYEDGGIYLVYGHNMKNGTMFAELTNYADEKYRNEHPNIHFDTLYERGQYEVIAAFYGKIYSSSEQGFCYYHYTNLADPMTFHEYIEQVKKAALYDTGATAEFGDQLLMLSTCDYHEANGRFVVVAKKVS